MADNKTIRDMKTFNGAHSHCRRQINMIRPMINKTRWEIFEIKRELTYLIDNDRSSDMIPIYAEDLKLKREHINYLIETQRKYKRRLREVS